ncbi:MAG: histidine phosphatase family protein [Actinomycetota bacterium]
MFVRHGATEWNLSRRAQGQADVTLTDEGRAQAERTAGLLASETVDAIYSSDLSRALETARPIAEVHGLEVTQDPAFREIDQGEWTGLPLDEIEARWPELWQGGLGKDLARRPHGESPAQVRERALAALRPIVEAHPHGTVVVVSHGGAIRWVVAEALGYRGADIARLRGMANGGVIALEAVATEGSLVLRQVERMDGAPPDLDDPNA